jgi:hypothetical protein
MDVRGGSGSHMLPMLLCLALSVTRFEAASAKSTDTRSANVRRRTLTVPRRNHSSYIIRAIYENWRQIYFWPSSRSDYCCETASALFPGREN